MAAANTLAQSVFGALDRQLEAAAGQQSNPEQDDGSG